MIWYGIHFILIEHDWGKTLAFFIICPSLVRSFTAKKYFTKRYFWMCRFIALTARSECVMVTYACVFSPRESDIIVNKIISVNQESQCQMLSFLIFHNPILDEWFWYLNETFQQIPENKPFFFHHKSKNDNRIKRYFCWNSSFGCHKHTQQKCWCILNGTIPTLDRII